MASKSSVRLSHLWQFPLLLVSLALFGYAAKLFFNIHPGPTLDQKIEIAQTYLNEERPEAAIDFLNSLLQNAKMDGTHEGKIHLMLAAGLEMLQRQKPAQQIPAYNQQIVEQTQSAFSHGVPGDGAAYRRLAESYESLHKPDEALDYYRRALLLDKEHSLRLQRKIINLQLDQDNFASAAQGLHDFLANKDLSQSERAWGLTQTAHLQIDRGEFAPARETLAQAASLSIGPIDQGQINYWTGYCAWKLGDNQQAERYLRIARDQFHSRHPLDADASFLLGKLSQQQNDAKTAESFYEIVLMDHPESKVAPLARLNRGVCRILTGDTNAGLGDLHDIVNLIDQKEKTGTSMRAQAIDAVQQASQFLSQRDNLQDAIEALSYEQILRPNPTPGFFGRLEDVFERRADQLDKIAQAGKTPEQIRAAQEARDCRIHAGDASVACSHALIPLDDKTYADALWHGIDLYDRAGDLHRAIAALQMFVAERPEDPLAPEALLRLGRDCQAAGLFDKAVATFQQIQFRYPKSFAASKCAVPLAQAFLAKGPEFYGKAESVLLQILENNPALTPEAQEFRQALFELAQLYYRTGRYEEAVGRLEELVDRYPDEQRLGQLLFLTGDSYRKSANLLGRRISSATRPSDEAEASAAKKDRLLKARDLYDRTIEAYRLAPPATDLDQLYQKLSYFFRADCVFDLGNYEQAIHLYDAAAFRYQDDPSALAAYVQIVNSYRALGKMDEARTANERAKWLLQRMPAEAFENGGFTMPREYWDQWLKWANTLAANQ